MDDENSEGLEPQLTDAPSIGNTVLCRVIKRECTVHKVQAVLTISTGHKVWTKLPNGLYGNRTRKSRSWRCPLESVRIDKIFTATSGGNFKASLSGG